MRQSAACWYDSRKRIFSGYCIHFGIFRFRQSVINTYLWTAPGFMDSAWNRKDTDQKRLDAQREAFASGQYYRLLEHGHLPENRAEIRLGTVH